MWLISGRLWDVKSPLRVIQQQQSSISISSRAALISFLSPSLHISAVEAASLGAPYWTEADLLDRHSGRFLKK